jgi:hypothetical protein
MRTAAGHIATDLETRGNDPLQSLAFMQACGFESAFAVDAMLAATIAMTAADTIADFF